MSVLTSHVFTRQRNARGNAYHMMLA